MRSTGRRSTRSRETFHPTFLYELIYDLAMAGVLILIGNRFRIRPPGLFALYVAFYTFGRTLEELLRVDPSHHFAGERLNFWVSLVVFLVASGVLHLVAVHPQGRGRGPRRRCGSGSRGRSRRGRRWPSRRAASARAASLPAVP